MGNQAFNLSYLDTEMAPIRHKLLIVDDDPMIVRVVTDILTRDELVLLQAADGASGLKLAAKHRPHIALVDLYMPGINGMDLLEKLLDLDSGMDVILMTGNYSTASAVEAIQKGAYDYLTKPLDVQGLRAKIERWLADADVRNRAHQLDAELARTCRFEGIIGRDPAMLEVFSKLRRIAPHFDTVLVTGETGTGKELAAAALHRLSRSPSGPFAVCNCAAVADGLFESQFFGHVKGAFTGAVQEKQGLFEFAHKGILFLDEIGEIPLAAQAKLLRALQSREILRVGAVSTQKVDVRVIAATNRDLRAMVAGGTFREDLYYRIATIELKLPRLIDRREDLPLLQRHFLEMYSKKYGRSCLSLSRRAETIFAAYRWPGNVRELESVISYACMMATGDIISAADLPPKLLQSPPRSSADPDELLSLEEVQMHHIAKVLERTGGNRARAAEILGVGRTTLYRMCKKDRETPLHQLCSPDSALQNSPRPHSN